MRACALLLAIRLRLSSNSGLHRKSQLLQQIADYAYRLQI